MIRRVMLIAVLGVTGLGLQTSIFSAVTLLGTKPELLLLIVVALAMTEGAGLGAGAGFVLGSLTDSVGGLPQGIGALTFTLAGYTVGTLRTHFSTPSAWLPMWMVATTTFVAIAFYGIVSVILGEETLTLLRLLRHAFFSAIYGALITPFCYPAVRALTERTRRSQSLEAVR